ncbi:MAG TPA: acyl-CoA dehydrogenase [Syntrophomonadaceae bacterium]|nr:acyl-CoA dehydrogenase [Syntrophomonadaceae bacterium]HPR93546.1 acyl-CoA dehydrogenase [Syntrophomonadaceae bacterium]
MAEKYFSRRNIDFLLNEVFEVNSLTRFPYYADHNDLTFKMTLDTAQKIADNMMYPVFKEMDRQAPVWEDGKVKVHPAVKEFMKEQGKGGWINVDKPYEVGGQQLPSIIKLMAGLIFSAANYSLSVYTALTMGAANLIFTFGTQEMKDQYLPGMYSGEWQGTMALTEPDVGSSLGDLTTQAEDTGKGYYLIKGKKIFISAGNSDAVDNVIHMMLARIKGAPAGVKGISLFIVPENRYREDGGLEYNDVACGGIEHKMGYRGSPICQLSMGEEGDCRGWLIGEAGKGLAHMFTMMNEERLNVGMGATGKVTAAYYASLEYARQRLQGRRLMEKDPNTRMVPIIEHPDIKRLLLFQRAVAEGSLSLLAQLFMYDELAKFGDEKEKYELLLDFLVPIAKTYPSEMGILTCSAAIQILGGYGYCGDFPVEQYYRDIRIDPIHEGTTGIQGMDMLGRKVVMKQGKAFNLFIEEVSQTIDQALIYDELSGMAKQLQENLERLKVVAGSLLEWAMQGKTEEFMADSVLFLEFIGIIAIAWQWLKQAVVCCDKLKNMPADSNINFYMGKIYTARYFFEYELSKTVSLAVRLTSKYKLTAEMPASCFEE